MTLNQIITKYKTDTAFAEKYSALKSIEEILKQAKADGYDVVKEDVQRVIYSLSNPTGELSEDDLAVVAGGIQHKEKGDDCYFEPSGQQEFRNNTMRLKCSQSNCLQRRLKADNYTWADFWCKCYGKNSCIGMWHTVAPC